MPDSPAWGQEGMEEIYFPIEANSGISLGQGSLRPSDQFSITHPVRI